MTPKIEVACRLISKELTVDEAAEVAGVGVEVLKQKMKINLTIFWVCLGESSDVKSDLKGSV